MLRLYVGYASDAHVSHLLLFQLPSFHCATECVLIFPDGDPNINLANATFQVNFTFYSNHFRSFEDVAEQFPSLLEESLLELPAETVGGVTYPSLQADVIVLQAERYSGLGSSGVFTVYVLVWVREPEVEQLHADLQRVAHDPDSLLNERLREVVITHKPDYVAPANNATGT